MEGGSSGGMDGGSSGGMDSGSSGGMDGNLLLEAIFPVYESVANGDIVSLGRLFISITKGISDIERGLFS